MSFFARFANECLSTVSEWFMSDTPPGEVVDAKRPPAPRAAARKRLHESPQMFTREQVERANKKARVATSYKERLERKREGESSKSIAREIGESESIDERTVRRWAYEINNRGDALRKAGSGRPVKYDDDVLAAIKEANDMYGGNASGRDVAEILKDKFGFGSHARERSFVVCILSRLLQM